MLREALVIISFGTILNLHIRSEVNVGKTMLEETQKLIMACSRVLCYCA